MRTSSAIPRVPVQDGLKLQCELNQLVQELRRVGQEMEEPHDGGRHVWFLSRFPSLEAIVGKTRKGDQNYGKPKQRISARMDKAPS